MQALIYLSIATFVITFAFSILIYDVLVDIQALTRSLDIIISKSNKDYEEFKKNFNEEADTNE